jgi:hypothetical protein
MDGGAGLMERCVVLGGMGKKRGFYRRERRKIRNRRGSRGAEEGDLLKAEMGKAESRNYFGLRNEGKN